MEKLTLTVRDVQEALGIGRNAAYCLANRADFPAIRLGNKLIIPRDAFLRWLEA
ncbi:MAG: helix-turn-helix domain-containing protein, partial [Lachnospiraceae bacterium]|nr:helix-turn-helix domain-containing protein [Lachnospiraceae bacterium]